MWLTSNDTFDADSFSADIVGIAAAVGHHDSGMHSHQKGQLLFAYRGCMSITLSDRKCILPPTRLAWIPPGISHRAQMHGTIDYRSIYIRLGYLALNYHDICIVSVSPLLREVLERIAFWVTEVDLNQPANKNLLAVLVDELNAAESEPMLLSLPKDRRLQGLNKLLEDAYCLPGLGALADQVGASDKTITRIFRKETGMSYLQWRQQWRLMRAIELLCDGLSVTSVADHLSFASDSAFISFFRQHTGETPKRYLNSNNSH